MTARARAASALAVLLLGAAAWWGLARDDAPPHDATTAPPVAAKAAQPARRPRDDAAPEPRAAANASDAAPAVAAETTAVAPDDDARRTWPIRVTTNVPGSTVTLQFRLRGGEPDPPPETKTTDAKSFVGFAGAAKDADVARLEFVARAEGWTTARTTKDAPGDVRVELVRAVALRGRVVDESGRPVSRACLIARDPSQWATGGYGNTVFLPSDGTFETFVAKPGPVSFYALSESHLLKALTVTAPANELVVVLDRGLQIAGRVEFTDGRPLPGATVEGDFRDRRATSDDDGRFVLSGLEDGPVKVTCRESEESKTVAAGATGVVFTVGLSVARVRFLDTKGRPYRFAASSIRVSKDGADLVRFAGADPADGVEFVPGPPGAMVLISAKEAGGETGNATVTFDDRPRLHDVDVVIGPPRPPGTIRLVVRSESGETLRRTYAAITDASGGTVAGGGEKALDATGAVELHGVPAGHVDIAVADAAHWSVEALDTLLVAANVGADVEAGRTTEIVATLVVGGRVRASVVDEDGRAVTPGSLRLLTSPNGRQLGMFVHRRAEGGFTTRLDATPSVLIDAVPPGRYVVQTKGPAGDEVSKEVEVVRGETADVVLTVKAKR